jgi:hypothetical protein
MKIALIISPFRTKNPLGMGMADSGETYFFYA